MRRAYQLRRVCVQARAVQQHGSTTSRRTTSRSCLSSNPGAATTAPPQARTLSAGPCARDGAPHVMNRFGIFDGASIARALTPEAKGRDAGAFVSNSLDAGGLILPISKNAVMRKNGNLAFLTQDQVEASFEGVRYDGSCGTFRDEGVGGNGRALPLIYVGRSTADDEHGQAIFTLDLSESSRNLGGLDFEELRTVVRSDPHLFQTVRARAVSRAGYGVALANWARGQKFCVKCGSRTAPTDLGTRVRCTNPECGLKAYPRTDPVAIMLVESPDGSECLLASPRYASGRMLTCLAGFVEQGETLEEAVRREVWEEAGVNIGTVDILGSQPWPLGRSGSCELMVGCFAKATTKALDVDANELNSAQWVSREVVMEKLERARTLGRRPQTKPKTNTHGKGKEKGTGKGSEGGEGATWIVPPYAIAHHLIAAWVRDGQEAHARL